MDGHDLVSKLKQAALELNRTPTRAEFLTHSGVSEYKLEKVFKNYSALCQAAGLDPQQSQKPKKLTNAIFERDIEKHLESYEPRVVETIKPYPTMAIISDVHWPFENQRVIDAFYKYVQRYKPEYAIINGDARDYYSFSRFPKSHNIFTPREENNLARKKNEEFWKTIQRASPESKLTQTLGNHCVRPMRQLLEAYPEAEDWIAQGLKADFTFEGVNTIYDPREEFMVGEIMVVHGYRTKLGDHRDFSMHSCFVGHSHLLGVVYKRIRGRTLFECNSGYAADPESKGLSYTPQKITHWTPGFAVLNEYGPQCVMV